MRVEVALAEDPFGHDAALPSLREALDGRSTRVDAAISRDRDVSATVLADARSRRIAVKRLEPALNRTAQLVNGLSQAIEQAGGHVEGVDYASPGLIASVPRKALGYLAQRGDVASIDPAPKPSAMGALANEATAVGAPTWWTSGHLGGAGTADLVETNLAVMDDKIQEDQPLFHGANFERPLNVIVGTTCGQATAGCEHGTEVAGMVVATGNTSCGALCTADTGNEKGVAYGVGHVLDADFGAMADADVCGFNSALWAFGFNQPPIGRCNHSMPGASHVSYVHTDSHGSYTTIDDAIPQRNLDKFTSSFGAVQTEPSGNDGLNGAGSGYITDSCIAYDVICAGGVAVGDTSTTSDDEIANFSSQGPSPAGRKKPDIVAVAAGGGSTNMSVVEQRWIANNRLERGATGTSFASPQVAGGAALLYGAGITDPLAIKAILLDSTTLGRATPASPMGTQSTWQPDWGWGELNLDSAFQERNNFGADEVPAQNVRFYRATVAAGDRATLVWNRRVLGAATQTAVPQPLVLSNLDLYQFDAASQTEQASSTSSIDNVEQVTGIGSGAVVYKVKNQSASVDGLSAEPFALAATKPVTALAVPKPTVALTVDRASVRQGDDVVVTETIRNPSADMSGSGATATLTLPAGVSVISGGTTSWTPGSGTLATNATSSRHWIVRGTDDGLKQLTASASVSAYGETFTASASAGVRIDSTPPSPSIHCPAAGTVGNFAMSWGATDASAIASYEVLVSTDGGVFVPWLQETSANGAAFAGQAGHTYGFQVSATDVLGNVSGFASCGPVAIQGAPQATTKPPGGGLQTGGAVLPAAAHLRVSRVLLRGSRAVVTGSLAHAATGSVKGIYASPGSRTAKAHARVARGRYELTFRLSRALRRAPRPVIRISYSGDRLYAPQLLKRRVRR